VDFFLCGLAKVKARASSGVKLASWRSFSISSLDEFTGDVMYCLKLISVGSGGGAGFIRGESASVVDAGVVENSIIQGPLYSWF